MRQESCWFCRLKLAVRRKLLAVSLLVKGLRGFKVWRVYYVGSDYADFRKYEIVGSGWIVRPFTGVRWPACDYPYKRAVDKLVMGPERPHGVPRWLLWQGSFRSDER